MNVKYRWIQSLTCVAKVFLRILWLISVIGYRLLFLSAYTNGIPQTERARCLFIRAMSVCVSVSLSALEFSSNDWNSPAVYYGVTSFAYIAYCILTTHNIIRTGSLPSYSRFRFSSSLCNRPDCTSSSYVEFCGAQCSIYYNVILIRFFSPKWRFLIFCNPTEVLFIILPRLRNSVPRGIIRVLVAFKL